VLGLDGLVEKDTKTHSIRTVALDDGTVAALTVDRVRALVEGKPPPRHKQRDD
jgi:hypothetical protein